MKTEWFRFGLEELCRVRTLQDIGNLIMKYPFFTRRLFEVSRREAKLPLALQLEPTNFCNISCICCSRRLLARAVGFMKMDLFKKIIDDAAENRVRIIYLYLHGEPFLHPQIMEMIAYLKKKGLASVITTNGMLLDRDVTRQLFECGMTNADHLIISMLGNTKLTHERIMEGVHHEQVIQNIEWLLTERARRGSSGPIIEAAIYRMTENAHEVDEFVSRWRGIVDHVRKPAAISKQFSASASCIHRTDSCKNISERLTIHWDGMVGLCHADVDGYYNFGNMADIDIRAAWNAKELLSIREMHLERRFEDLRLCAHCDWI